jgi:hypothetical protein
MDMPHTERAAENLVTAQLTMAQLPTARGVWGTLAYHWSSLSQYPGNTEYSLILPTLLHWVEWRGQPVIAGVGLLGSELNHLNWWLLEMLGNAFPRHCQRVTVFAVCNRPNVPPCVIAVVKNKHYITLHNTNETHNDIIWTIMTDNQMYYCEPYNRVSIKKKPIRLQLAEHACLAKDRKPAL